jgi:hypothetical protein
VPPQGHREGVAPVVLQALREVSEACPAGAPAAQLPGPRVAGLPQLLLLKAAVYHAVAAGSYDLHDYLDYRAWLGATLLQASGPHCLLAPPRLAGFGVAATAPCGRPPPPLASPRARPRHPSPRLPRCCRVQELQDTRPEAQGLRAAAATLVGAWIPRLQPEDRPPLYGALLGLLACRDM